MEWDGPQPDLVSALSQTLALARVEVWLKLDNKEEKVGGLWRYLKRKRDAEGPRMLVRGGQMGQGIKGEIVGKTLGTGERSNSLGDQKGGGKRTSAGQENFS